MIEEFKPNYIIRIGAPAILTLVLFWLYLNGEGTTKQLIFVCLASSFVLFLFLKRHVHSILVSSDLIQVTEKALFRPTEFYSYDRSSVSIRLNRDVTELKFRRLSAEIVVNRKAEHQLYGFHFGWTRKKLLRLATVAGSFTIT